MRGNRVKGSGFRVQGCGGGFAALESSGRSCSGIRFLAAQDDETGRCPKVCG